MLPKQAEEAARCYARAEECARKAERASSEEMREDYLRLQKNWQDLACRYELAERLTNASEENKRRRAEFFGDKSVH